MLLVTLTNEDMLPVDSDESPITAATKMASGVLQQVVLPNPQHHVDEVDVPSHGLTSEFKLPSYDDVSRLALQKICQLTFPHLSNALRQLGLSQDASVHICLQ